MENMMLGERYQLIEKVGEGGMAVVYKAMDIKLNRAVALKILKENFKENDAIIKKFQAEARAVAMLSNPNIVNVLDVGTEDGINYIVMEFVKGKTLKEIIVENKKLPVDVSIRIAIKVSTALECAHKANIIHRDIKPHNILVTADGTVKVTDFGIAKSMDSSTLAHTNTIIGSAHYFSPEQAKGGYMDYKTDIYSLGVVMYEMLTGKIPFEGDTAVTVALKHIQEKPVPPIELNSNIPKSLNDLVLKCLAKDPASRYQTARELTLDLDKIKENPDVALGATPNSNDYTRVIEPVSMDETMILDKHEDLDATNANMNVGDPVLADIYEDEDYDDDDDDYNSYADERESKQNYVSNKEKSKKGFVIALIVVVAIVIAGGVYLGVSMANSGNKPNKNTSQEQNKVITVPNLATLTETQAIAQLKQANIPYTIDVEASSDVPKGSVIKTDPAYGTTLTEGQKITLYISTGTKEVEKVQIPNIIGMTLDNAKSTLSQLGLVIQTSQGYSNTVAKGEIISIDPSVGSEIEKGSTVNLVVSQGVQEVSVPNVVGMSLAQAKQAIQGAGFVVGNVTQEHSDSVANGNVISTSPSGTTSKGATVNIVVSSGKEVQMVAVPNVEQKSVQDATAALEGAGLKVSAVKGLEAPDASKNGVVYQQNPGSGYQVKAGSTITITYYADAKPAPETTPNNNNNNNSGANSNSGTNSNNNGGNSSNGQNKPTTSNDVNVPNVVGQTVGNAIKTLKAAGLVPYANTNDNSAIVKSQTWVAGRPAPKGSSINISTK
ncbi:MAG: Stk1 family PASTA domain-containing Ser/Thr kinase [Sarcina sp.]